MLRYIGSVVVAVVVLAGCGSDTPASTVTATPTATPSTSSPAPTTAPVAPSAPVVEPTQEAPAVPETQQVVPPVSPGEPVELQFPPLSEQPAPGTAPGTSSDSTNAGEITCETVCTSTGCEQYQYSVLGCP